MTLSRMENSYSRIIFEKDYRDLRDTPTQSDNFNLLYDLIHKNALLEQRSETTKQGNRSLANNYRHYEDATFSFPIDEPARIYLHQSILRNHYIQVSIDDRFVTKPENKQKINTLCGLINNSVK
jgi:hypothetical protein